MEAARLTAGCDGRAAATAPSMARLHPRALGRVVCGRHYRLVLLAALLAGRAALLAATRLGVSTDTDRLFADTCPGGSASWRSSATSRSSRTCWSP